jgi:hypothetical protein
MFKGKWLFIPIMALLSAFVLSACGQDVSVEEAGITVDAPQGEDEGFRADPVDKVASTGKPQLVEIWASW